MDTNLFLRWRGQSPSLTTISGTNIGKKSAETQIKPVSRSAKKVQDEDMRFDDAVQKWPGVACLFSRATLPCGGEAVNISFIAFARRFDSRQ